MRQPLHVFCSLVAALLILMDAAMARDSEMEDNLDKAFAAGELSGLHSVLVIHRGSILAEKYYPGGSPA